MSNRQIPKGDISASKINSYMECPRAFFESRKPGERKRATGAMRVGSLVHGALENACIARLNTYMTKDSAVTAKELHGYLPRVEQALEGPGPAGELFTARTILENVAPKLDYRRAVGAEQAWTMPLGDKGETACGVLDLVEQDESGVITVTDYKTGQDVPSREQLEDAPQNLLYLAAAHYLWPKATGWRVRFWWVEPDVKHVFDWSPDVDEVARTHALAMLRRIKEDQVRTPVTGTHCAYCLYKEGCPGYAALLRTDPETLKPSPTLSDDVLLAQRQRLQALHVVAEARRKEHDTFLKARIGRKGLVAGGFKAVSRSRPKRELPSVGAVADVLAKAVNLEVDVVFKSIAGIDDKPLKAFLAGLRPDQRELAMAALEEIETVFPGYTYLDVREVRGPF
jgi:hypothetical protein